MAERRTGLGKGLGALIPPAPGKGKAGGGQSGLGGANTVRRPVDLLFGTGLAGEGGPAGGASGAAAGAPGDRSTPGGPSTPGGQARSVAGSGARGARLARPAATAHAAGEAGEAGTATTADAVDAARGTGSAEDAASAARAETELVPVPGAEFTMVAIDAVTPNPRQPREVFDEDSLRELAESIKEVGLLQPVVVRPRTDSGQAGGPAAGAAAGGAASTAEAQYELVMGERRWRASRLAGLSEVPAIVRETEDSDLLRDALLENLHRAQLNPLEEAAAYRQLLDDFSCTQEELSLRIARSRPQISNTLRLLKLPPLVQRRLAAGVISAGHARALLALEDAAAMERTAQKIVAEGLSVRSTEEMVSLGEAPKALKTRSASAKPGTHRQALDELQDRLADRFDTKVTVSLGKLKGRITIEFASVADLNRIVEVIDPADPGVLKG
ncbi:MAG: ParB/RepB/Spo0J family partition protein [Bifidobacteriaceae bacterium]|jgi:ParB family chromosome partitioning protein|nr:ParB/RepB/Spo0J family partition protein [Bifidobacteriaceae bacterium]